MPGLTVDAMDWEFGSDRASFCVDGIPGQGCSDKWLSML